MSNTRVGYRFHPTDEEIIDHFLRHKMQGNDHLTKDIAEVDVCKWDPWDLPQRSAVLSNDQVWFFFYRLSYKYSNSQRANRTTNAGFWKVTGRERKIKARGYNKEIGTKKTLVFYEGRVPNGVRTSWVMHEYRSSPNFIPSSARPFVVCRLKKKADEKVNNSASDKGGSASGCPPSTSRNNAPEATIAEVGAHLQANLEPIPDYNELDYALALQSSMEEYGITLNDVRRDDQNWMQDDLSGEDDENWMQDGLSCEDLLSPSGYTSAQNVWQAQFDPMEHKEKEEFVDSIFADDDDDDDEHLYDENIHTRLHDYRPSTSMSGVYVIDTIDKDRELANTLNDQVLETSSLYDGYSNSKRYQHSRMDTPSDGSAAATSIQTNRIQHNEKLSINTITCKSLYQPRSHEAVAEKGPKRHRLVGGYTSKAVPRDKATEISESSAVTLVHSKKSFVESNEDHKIDKERNPKVGLSSRSFGTAGSDRKSSFIFLEMSRLSYKPSPPSVHIRNVLLGVTLFIFIVREAVFVH